jgi:hypothetical protein
VYNIRLNVSETDTKAKGIKKRKINPSPLKEIVFLTERRNLTNSIEYFGLGVGCLLSGHLGSYYFIIQPVF